jgi:hypothetical protein
MAAPGGAAKFREETPRKGGGFAVKDRNTALQQYAQKPGFRQALKKYFRPAFLGKIRKSPPYIWRPMGPFAAWCIAANAQFPSRDT